MNPADVCAFCFAKCRRVFLSLTVGASLVWFDAGCHKRETPVEEGIRTRTLLVGNQQEPAILDPHLMAAFTDFRIEIALFEELTALDEKTAKRRPSGATATRK